MIFNCNRIKWLSFFDVILCIHGTVFAYHPAICNLKNWIASLVGAAVVAAFNDGLFDPGLLSIVRIP